MDSPFSVFKDYYDDKMQEVNGWLMAQPQLKNSMGEEIMGIGGRLKELGVVCVAELLAYPRDCLL